MSENNMNTNRKVFPQLKTKRKSHTEMARRDRDMVWPRLILAVLQSSSGRDITALEVLPEDQRF